MENETTETTPKPSRKRQVTATVATFAVATLLSAVVGVVIDKVAESVHDRISKTPEPETD